MRRVKKLNWKYAIGEIFIVSIGILIAFSINTCSSNINKSKAHKEYQASLSEDLNRNLSNLNNIIKKQKEKIVNLESLIEKLDQQTFDLDTVAYILFKERKSPTFFPISGTFKSLVTHGDIELFSTNIRRELFNLYDTSYERTVYNGNLYDKMYLDIYDLEIRNILNLKTKKVENVNRLKSQKFLNNLSFIVDEAKSYLGLSMKCKKESERVLEMIDG